MGQEIEGRKFGVESSFAAVWFSTDKMFSHFQVLVLNKGSIKSF